MRAKVSVPTNVSVMILNASALNGASSDASRISSSSFMLMPCIGGMSSGLGR